VHGKPRVTAALVDLAAAEVLPLDVHRGRGWRILGWCLLLAGAGLLWLATAGAELT
jgi:hypothetical protein